MRIVQRSARGNCVTTKALADPENLTARVVEAVVTPVKEAISKRKV